MSDNFYNAIGMIGPVAFTFVYLMVSLNYWNGQQVRTHVVNLIGALAVLVSLLRFWNLPIFVLEIAWGVISIYGIWRCRKTLAR